MQRPRTHRQSVGEAEAGSLGRTVDHSRGLDRTEVVAVGSIHLEAAPLESRSAVWRWEMRARTRGRVILLLPAIVVFVGHGVGW